jgi:hypothetical protein
VCAAGFSDDVERIKLSLCDLGKRRPAQMVALGHSQPLGIGKRKHE